MKDYSNNTTIRLDSLNSQVSYVDENVNSIKIKKELEDVYYRSSEEYYIAKGLYLNILPVKELLLSCYITNNMLKTGKEWVYNKLSNNIISIQNMDYCNSDDCVKNYDIIEVSNITEIPAYNIEGCPIFKMSEEYNYYPIKYIKPETNTNNSTTQETENGGFGNGGIFVPDGTIPDIKDPINDSDDDTNDLTEKQTEKQYKETLLDDVINIMPAITEEYIKTTTIIIDYDLLGISVCDFFDPDPSTIAETQEIPDDSNEDKETYDSNEGEEEQDCEKVGLLKSIESYITGILGIELTDVNDKNIVLRANKYYFNENSTCANEQTTNNTVKPIFNNTTGGSKLYTILKDSTIKSLPSETLQLFYSNSILNNDCWFSIDVISDELNYNKEVIGKNVNLNNSFFIFDSVKNPNDNVYGSLYKSSKLVKDKQMLLKVTFKGYEDFRIGLRLTCNNSNNVGKEQIYISNLNTNNTLFDVTGDCKLLIDSHLYSDVGLQTQTPLTDECVFSDLNKDKTYTFYIKDIVKNDFTTGSNDKRESYLWFPIGGLNEISPNEKDIDNFLDDKGLDEYFGNLFISKDLKLLL